MAKVNSAKKLVDAIILGMQEKKAKNIVVLNLGKIDNSICDFFVICDADSTTQVDAIAKSVEFIVKKEVNEDVLHKEGFENAIWILLDYLDVVVHVFQKESRDFYNLEEFWNDAEKLEIKNIY
ncbi:MAG: ribosome silencing factor [Bacteroidales bacterium]